ncbi:MAG TPA: hypothetical protein VF988_01695 [Verrucomicrobiae bacterium]
MKNLNKIPVAIAFISTLSLINVATAGDNQILTTPRQAWAVTHTQWVKGTPATPLTPVGYAKYGDYYVVTSPKDYQRVDEDRAQAAAQANATDVALVKPVGYRATGDDGITASPKFRQFLNERPQFQVAPVK